ncbi:MAG: hypothetical protein ACOC2C_03330, partial [Cyclonatronaceae bacterium]
MDKVACKQVWLTVFFFMLLMPPELFAQLERRRVQQDGPVELTFMAPKNINLYTTMSLSAGELHYSIMHTFGEVKQGPR